MKKLEDLAREIMAECEKDGEPISYDDALENYENVEVLNENKLICVKIGEKSFKIDLIEQKKTKK